MQIEEFCRLKIVEVFRVCKTTKYLDLRDMIERLEEWTHASDVIPLSLDP